MSGKTGMTGESGHEPGNAVQLIGGTMAYLRGLSRVQLRTAVRVALVLMSACTDRTPTAPTGVPTPSKGGSLDTLVIVSAPSVQLRSLASAVAGATSAALTTEVGGPSAAYVSLTPHTALGGIKAAIRNRRTGDSVVVSMVDGGFDPTPIAAVVDDSLTIDIRNKTSVILAATVRVPKRRPPTLVRTDPPKGKTDVPLNSQIAVVFSEPVDPATVAGGVRLFNGGTLVAGTVTLSPSGFIVEFSPDLQLAPTTAYELVVDTTVRNLMGEALDSTVHVPFVTGTSSGTTGASTVVASLAVSVLPSSVIVGRPLTFMVTVKDASGNVVTDYTGRLHIATTDPAAQLPPNYTFVGADKGSHIFTVTFGTAGDQRITATDAASSSNAGGFITVVTPAGFVALNSGVVSSCGLSGSGVAYCWGTNDLGRLGDGTTQDRLAPVPVAGGMRFTTLMTASVQACGLTIDWVAYCWGSNIFASLGTAAPTAPQMCYSSDWADEGIGSQPCSPSPLPVAGGLRFTALSAGGSSSTCGLTSDGTAYCWGYGSDGELGDGTTLNRNAPVPVAGGLHFASVSASGAHSCGLTTEGIAYCWGYNQFGELGDGTTTNHLVPVRVSGGLRFVALVSGAYHSCGLTTDGVAYCWGRNNFGQVGDEPPRDSDVPLPVSGGRRFTALTTLSWHTCGLTISGEAYCWGQNFDGQLGDGTTTNHYSPVLVSAGIRFVSLSAGHRHTCGITTDGTYCWGANDYGQFGDGTTTSSYVPVRAAGPP